MTISDDSQKILDREMSRRTKWIRQWVFFLKQNADYRAYCDAYCDEGNLHDPEACRLLENRYDYITELYYDWGDLKNVDVNHFSDSFQAWLQRRRSLFYVDEQIRVIDDVSAYTPNRGRVLLDIPLLRNKRDLMERITIHIDLLHELRMHVGLPKYSRYGVFNIATQGSLRRAIYAAKQRSVMKNGRPLSQVDGVIAAMQDPSNPFKWTMTDSDKAALERGTLKKSLFNGSKVKMLAKAGKDFDAIVRNTIHGRFPDFR